MATGGRGNDSGIDDSRSSSSHPSDDVPYVENTINLALLDPARFGWTASGGVADLLPPHEV